MRVSTSHVYNTGVQNMSGQQTALNESQNQLSSGRRVLRPSDDPSSAARVLDLERTVSSIERFNRNGDMARNRLSMSEGAIDQASHHLQRIRELTVQAANDSQDRQTRAYIATEIRERYDQLMQVANSTDGNGEYLFAGAKTRTRPFNMQPDGRVEYHGDQNTRKVRVGPGRSMAVDHSGFSTFMKVPNGNGHFQAYENVENRGSGVVTVVDQGVRRLDPQYDYRLRFIEDDDGDLRYAIERRQDSTDSWESVHPASGAALADDGDGSEEGAARARGMEEPRERGEGAARSLEAEPEARGGIEDYPRYRPGSAIEIEEGVRVQVDGEPEHGDTFTVSTSRPQSIFDTVHQLVHALEEQGQGAGFRNSVNRALGDIDLALENMFHTRAEVGARLSTLDTERASNHAALVDLHGTISSEEDLDYAEATGRFHKQLTGLEAAQATFGRVQNLSLFNYL
ncbi:flagellar hook-associated protein 3 [Halorhodospira abdelmalekii]|uniref:flagellar hook-associated protein FlgL n=1 Tax=Halorhodospira abdelmalekii TaxID=421629 RepID=UPI00190735CE|nr:flagellar hook-associated protein 3 [Halorhodospira abdelmalekii]